MEQNAIKLNEEDLLTKLNLEGRNNDLEEINMNKTQQNRKSECHEPRGKSYTTSSEVIRKGVSYMNTLKINQGESETAEVRFMKQVKSLIDDSYCRGLADGMKLGISKKVPNSKSRKP